MAGVDTGAICFSWNNFSSMSVYVFTH